MSKSLSHQLLRFCRRNTSNGSDIIAMERIVMCLDVNAIAELIAGGDIYGATILVCIMTPLVKKEGQEQEIISVANLMATIIDIYPTISDQLCLLVLIFKILCSVQHATLSDDETWLALIVKLINSIATKAADMWNHESLLVIGILCLILHHSANAVLIEASKTIIFSSSLVSTINSAIHEACLKGPALVDHDEGNKLRRNFNICASTKFLHFTKFSRCSTRLMHFGSPVVKLAASYCLLELFTRISEQRNRTGEELVCATKYLSLNQLLQVCRKQKYTDNTWDDGAQEHKKVVGILDDLGEVLQDGS
ncbi:hypothetical protein M0R45_001368 [Rubus argutus]|uniref:Uncharacterized protein n=1 Tax=Rubus argutus TaxID=59490 RepID=A0AAW1VIZ1_RUBAR